MERADGQTTIIHTTWSTTADAERASVRRARTRFQTW